MTEETPPEKPYNPLDKKNLGVSVSDALLIKPLCNLPPSIPFRGAGIYAIYYFGDFPLYQPLTERNRKSEDDHAPIYIGKAVPKGARRGVLEMTRETVLFDRLRDHGKSVEQCTNLNREDFRCKFLVVDDIWIPLGESLLINRYRPVWNVVIDGFGNHDPGGGRYNQQIAPWDLLHPGRAWASKLQLNRKMDLAKIEANVSRHFKDKPLDQGYE